VTPHRPARLLRFFSAALAAAALLAGCSDASRLNIRCYAGDLQRCRQLGDMYANGNGVVQDYARAAALYERVCEAGVSEVCNTLGQIYEHVPGFESESGRVAGLYERACTAGSANGCLNFGLFRASQEEFEQAALLFDRACTGGANAGCHALAAAYQNGEGVQKDISRAVALYDQACSADHVDSCLTLASLYTDGADVERDPARAGRYNATAIRICDEGCQSGITSDCRARDQLKTRVALQAAAGK
jgi:TPR repeat protein